MILHRAQSKDIARRRLKNVLSAERTGMSKSQEKLVCADVTKVVESYTQVVAGSQTLRIERRRRSDGGYDRVLVYSATIQGVKRAGIKL